MMARKKAESKEFGQPVINIGMVGHVDHGKTTLLETLSGKWADTHSEEIRRGITIRLGYADSVFRKCAKCDEYTVELACRKCKSETEAVRKVSFVDAPGHESLMATMLSGATIMDGALLLVAANERCPQPQTREHLMALEIIGLKNLIIIQNKIDLVSEEEGMKNYEQIREFIRDTAFKDAPIIPVSAQHKVGISNLIAAIEENFLTPTFDDSIDPIVFIARSFDINKPGSKLSDIVGGVLGGALKRGTLKVGDEIEIRPGYDSTEKNRRTWKTLTTKIVGLKTGGASVETVRPGGSIGILTSLDPAIVKSDNLSGNVAGYKGKVPPVLHELLLEIHLLKRVVGAEKDLDVEPIKLNEPLMLNVNASATIGIATKVRKDTVTFSLKRPVCAEAGSRATVSRMVSNRFRLIGYGIIKN